MPGASALPFAQVGKYKLISAIKSGGMGAVYRGKHVDTDRMAAVKLMHPTMVAHAKLRERFEQEARIGARIESQHIVQVLDVGVEMGTPWLAMELLEGEDLEGRVERLRRISPAETRTVFRQICHALALAHAQGIVHRDLKPENVFIAKSGSPDIPFTSKILDFGIAKLAADSKAAPTMMAGTRGWAAPEQMEHGKKVSPATDVWALGLIAFKLLTGKDYWLTFHDDEPTVQKWERELWHLPLAAASERADQLGVGVCLPPGFDAWFAGCIHRDSTRRFPHAGVAFAALDALLAATPAPSAVHTGTAPMLPATDPDPGLSAPPAPPAPPQLPKTALEPTAVLGKTTTSPTSHSATKGSSRSRPLVAGAVVLGVVAVFAVVVGLARSDGSGIGGAPTAPIAPPAVSNSTSASPSASGTAVVPRALPLNAADEPDMARIVGANGPFDLDRTEVTVGAYRACVEAGACTAPHADEGATATRRDPKLPVDAVDHGQASTFCAWKKRRLPTDEEWERAAKGTRGFEQNACFKRGDKPGAPCPVASFPGGATPQGVFDLAGSMSEWTSTSAPNGEYVVRGGGYDEPAKALLQKTQNPPGDHWAGLGFRCAKSPMP